MIYDVWTTGKRRPILLLKTMIEVHAMLSARLLATFLGRYVCVDQRDNDATDTVYCASP